jgi:hypothetical protein
MIRWKGMAATNGMERPCRGLGVRSPAGCPDPCRLLPLLLVASPLPGSRTSATKASEWPWPAGGAGRRTLGLAKGTD